MEKHYTPADAVNSAVTAETACLPAGSAAGSPEERRSP